MRLLASLHSVICAAFPCASLTEILLSVTKVSWLIGGTFLFVADRLQLFLAGPKIGLARATFLCFAILNAWAGGISNTTNGAAIPE